MKKDIDKKASEKNIKRKQYIIHKIISILAIPLFLMLLLVMLINIAIEYEIDISTKRALLHGLFYIPFLLFVISIYFKYRKKLKLIATDKEAKKTIKQKIFHSIINTIIIMVAIIIMLLLIMPYAALPMFINRHVNYRGYASANFPLQDIYNAKDYNLEEKQMFLKTEDGLDVWASEIYTIKPKAVIIYLTGIVQPSITYYYGHAKYMQSKDYASILLEIRGHGKSDGSRICLGYEEVNDVRAVVDYIKSEEKYKDVPIVLQGASMGGAIAVNAFGQIKDIDALIAISAYSSFEDVALDQMENLGIPSIIRSIEKPLIVSSLKLLFGRDKIRDIKPVEQIKKGEGRPVLLIASKGDTEVPAVNTNRLKKAKPDAEVWLRDSQVHFIIKDCDFKNVANDREYFSKILNFMEKIPDMAE